MRMNRRALVRTLNKMRQSIPTPDDRRFAESVKWMTTDELSEMEAVFDRHGVADRKDLPADARAYLETIMTDALARTAEQQPPNSFTTAATAALSKE